MNRREALKSTLGAAAGALVAAVVPDEVLFGDDGRPPWEKVEVVRDAAGEIAEFRPTGLPIDPRMLKAGDYFIDNNFHGRVERAKQDCFLEDDGVWSVIIHNDFEGA